MVQTALLAAGFDTIDAGTLPPPPVDATAAMDSSPPPAPPDATAPIAPVHTPHPLEAWAEPCGGSGFLDSGIS
jgi:hypothetical protein